MIKRLSKYIGFLSLCAKTGLIAGGLTGLTLTIMDLFQGSLSLSVVEAVYVTLIMAGFSWLVILFLLGIALRYSFRSFAFASLVNCLLTCFVTVFFVRYIHAYPLAWLIGMLMGILIGSILCRLNYLFTKK